MIRQENGQPHSARRSEHQISPRAPHVETPAVSDDLSHDNAETSAHALPKDAGPPSWLSLPSKDQLAILALARLAEPITQTSIIAYMFFMLKSFDGKLSDAEISAQAGLLSAGFTGAQAVTAMFWGRFADKDWVGRKNVLLTGLFGAFLATLGFGFSRSFAWALFFRVLGGALNGNVGVMRTMISEIVEEKKYLPKAFLIMPFTYNVGVLIGPVLGGWLAEPFTQYPDIFGPGSAFGGEGGVLWMQNFPYALPALVTAVVLLASLLLLLFGLEETHLRRRYRSDPFLQAGRAFARAVCRPFRPSRVAYSYQHLPQNSQDSIDSLELSHRPGLSRIGAAATSTTAPVRVFTPNVIATLTTHGFFAAHLGIFNTLWFIFLSTPRAPVDLPRLAGGLALSPQTLGFAVAIIGAIGLCLQLGIYSRVVHAFGVLQTFRFAAILFPITYTLVPLLVYTVPIDPASPSAKSPSMWLTILGLLFIQTLGRTFGLPGTQVLINNSAPSRQVLGTIHGLGMSVSAAARTLGPVVFSLIYGWGLTIGNVGFAWWLLAIEAAIVNVTSRWVRDGAEDDEPAPTVQVRRENATSKNKGTGAAPLAERLPAV